MLKPSHLWGRTSGDIRVVVIIIIIFFYHGPYVIREFFSDYLLAYLLYSSCLREGRWILLWASCTSTRVSGVRTLGREVTRDRGDPNVRPPP